MKRKRPVRSFVSVLLLAAMTLSFSGCGEKPDEDTETTTAKPGETTEKATETESVTEPPKEIAAVYPKNGETVSLLNEEMTKWAKNYRSAKLDKIADLTEKCEPVPVVLRWENADGALYSHVLISDDEKMENPTVYLCSTSDVAVFDLFADETYFWQVAAEYGDRTERSAVFSFTTMYAPRTVAIDGVSNARDIGGYKTEDGKRVKRGVVYRGADFARITEDGINKLVNVLGVKTELDLRSNTNKGPSVLGEGIKYVSVSGPWYEHSFENDYKKDLAAELRVFADADNYPVYFHCSLGRDRTGTLAFLLLALCGVSKNDITMDYEVSFFSDCGGYVDSAVPSSMTRNNLDGFRKTVQSYAKDKSLSEATRAFMLSLDLTDAEIDAIRANLLEEG